MVLLSATFAYFIILFINYAQLCCYRIVEQPLFQTYIVTIPQLFLCYFYDYIRAASCIYGKIVLISFTANFQNSIQMALTFT